MQVVLPRAARPSLHRAENESSKAAGVRQSGGRRWTLTVPYDSMESVVRSAGVGSLMARDRRDPSDPGGHRRAAATHRDAAVLHGRAAQLHDASADLHELHAVHMKNEPEKAARAIRIAARQRGLARAQRALAAEARTDAAAETASSADLINPPYQP